MKELFFSFWSSEWSKFTLLLILFILVTFGINKFSILTQGKRRKRVRNFQFINEKLRGQGFLKWGFIDLLIYFCLAIIFGFAIYTSLKIIAKNFAPIDIIYQGDMGNGIIILSSLFFGCSAPSFFWVKLVKIIHKNRYKKFLLYMMASQQMDILCINRIIIQPLCVLALIIGLLGTNVFEVIKGNQLIERNFLSTSSKVHLLYKIDDLLVAKKIKAQNGDSVERVRLILKFNDGYIWQSASLDNNFTRTDMTFLARHIFEVSNIKPRVVEFSPYD